MKRYILFSLLLITSCVSAQQFSFETKKIKAAKIKSVTIWRSDQGADTTKYKNQVKFYNKNGELTKKIKYYEREDIGNTGTYLFDLNGNEIKTTVYNPYGKMVTSRSYLYNKTGQKISEINHMATLDTNDDVTFKYLYVKNEKKQPYLMYETSHGDTIQISHFKYDSNGNNTEISSSYCNRNLFCNQQPFVVSHATITSWDTDGNINEKKSISFDQSIKALHKEINSYNQLGFLKKQLVYGNYETLDYILTFEYEFY